MNQERSDASGNGDLARFFATWIRHPVKMGAVAPSSRAYCAMMVRHATTHLEGPILELGPGLGVVTRALLEAGVAPERITSVEYDRDFAATLKRRFPRVNVIAGDGFDLDATLPDQMGTCYAAILFAIPILNFPRDRRQAIFSDYIRRLAPGGNITQLSYAWSAPVKPVPGLFSARSSPIVWANVPPARVWIYDREASSNPSARPA